MKLIISGCNGRMGRTVARLISEREDMEIAAGIDVHSSEAPAFPFYADFSECSENCDAVIDFSNPSALDSLLTWCIANNTPVVLCTTGYSDEQLRMIEHVSGTIPVFRSANMSLGVSLVCELAARASSVLGQSFDIEILEKHHNKKLDAPSGTAIMLADAASSTVPGGLDYVYERQSRRAQRGPRELGISSIRGGTIVGEHEVIYAGQDEVIEIKHTAYSRDVFANGALAAARFIASVTKPGLYDMSSLLQSI